MAASRSHVSSASPYESQIGFSRAIRVGNLVAVSGTAPVGDDGEAYGVGDIEAQTRRCLELILKAISGLGGSASDVFRTRIFITDVSLWGGVAKVHGEVFGEVRPAATCVGVSSLLDERWLVEIEADAWIDD